MTAILVRLEPRAIAATWPKIEKLVADAATRSRGRYLAEDVRALAEKGEWQLWLAIDQDGICAVAGTSFIPYPRLTAFHVQFGTGRNRERWQHLMDELVAWGLANGATKAQGEFRIGWRRVLPGWTHTHDFVERDS